MAMSNICCDTCDKVVDLEAYYHHCPICEDGNFDLCQSCVDGGRKCHDAAHILDKTFAKTAACPGCAYKRSQDQVLDQADIRSLDQYNFPSLQSPDAFRLLELEKTPEHEPLRYTLHDRLYDQERHNFIAVSYVCGDTTDLVPSICNGRLHQIYRNLDHGLRRIRKHYLESPRVLTIWADGICINQQNATEKVDQIANMWRVFRSCTQVVVCLGPSCEHADQALELFHELAQEFDGLNTGPKGFSSQNYGQHGQKSMSLQQARAMYEFFGCPWFSRTWVVQEVNLCTNHRSPPLFLWGDSEISWTTLIRSSLTANKTRLWFNAEEEFKDVTVKRASVAVLKVYHALHSVGLPTHAPALRSLLEMTWHLKAWDPRDKIYGILALLNQQYGVQGAGRPQADQRVEGKRQIIVSYDESFEKLYERIARTIIDEENSVVLLTCAGTSRPRSKQLPSWVPDWSHITNCEPLKPLESSREASVNPTCLIKNLFDGDGLLQVEGFFLDPIVTYASCSVGEFGESQPLQESGLDTIHNPIEYIAALWDCFSHYFPRYPTGEFRLEAFARTLIANSLDAATFDTGNQCLYWSLITAMAKIQDQKLRCLCPKEYSRRARTGFDDEVPSNHFDQNMSGPRDLHPKSMTAPAWHRRPQSNLEQDLAEKFEGQEPDMGTVKDDEYIAAVASHGQYRRFFVSDRRFIGIGPAGLRRGDSVALLEGCSLPFILRIDKEAAGNKCSCHPRVFKLIGEAYVHGLSANEPLDKWRDFTRGENSPSNLPDCAEPKTAGSESEGPWVRVYLS